MENKKIDQDKPNGQRITNNIKIDDNIEVLKKYFPNCFDKEGNFNIEKFKEEIEINEVNLSKESYSLEWLGKSYARVLTFEPARTLLREDEEWNNKEENKNSGNILIKGNNLEVLKHLVNAYHEKIKMIYIDPPYNTGNDGFVYNDDRKFKVDELAKLAGIDEEKAKRILDFVNSKSNSHSAWLTFMYPRFYIARRLLREDGVIFVSIDDNEVAQLRILMDEIFGEENFVAQLIWKNKSGGANDSSHFAIDHEYLLVFAKDSSKIDKFLDREYKPSTRYNYEDEKGRYALDRLDKQSIRYSPSLDYVIIGPDGKEYKPEHKDPSKPNATWRWNKETVEKRYNELVFKDGHVYTKNYEKNEYIARSLLIEERFGRTRTGKTELYNLFTQNIFQNPKPSKLIKFLISIAVTNKNDLILDFFAGSGTTGDAVMQLNAEDVGNRKFILVQIDEPIDPNKNKTAYDFVKNELGEDNPTIFHICKERLVRAAKKIKEETINKKIEEKEREIEEAKSQLGVNGDKEEKIKQLEQEIENLKNQDLGFKIFETIPIWEDYLLNDKELNNNTEVFKKMLSDSDIKALLITWKTYDGLPLTENYKEIELDNYTAYYCGTNLYLLYYGWKTDNIRILLEKIDKEEDFVVNKIIIFGYNFKSTDMREIEENVRNYANKKQIEIETIIRF